VPGEKSSPTQPIPTKPAPYARTFISKNDLIDFTPQLRQEALEVLTHFRWEEAPYVPLILGNVNGKLGTINIGNTAGGVNWPGSAFDPETGWFYTQASNSQVTVGSLAPPPPGFSDIQYQSGVAGRPFRLAVAAGTGTNPDAPESARRAAAAEAGPPPPPPPSAGGRPPVTGANVQGLSIVKPPYGVVAAIDVNKGELMWQVPHGDTPDNVRNHPALKGLNIPKTGQNGSVGTLVTKTLVISGDPSVTSPPGRPRGAMLHAYDKKTGAELGAVYMPAAQSGSPMTYSVDGKQYIVVAVSGGNYSGEYIAFSLPDSEIKSGN
jgi:quinoprotein glucose dehydrogenase